MTAFSAILTYKNKEVEDHMCTTYDFALSATTSSKARRSALASIPRDPAKDIE